MPDRGKKDLYDPWIPNKNDDTISHKTPQTTGKQISKVSLASISKIVDEYDFANDSELLILLEQYLVYSHNICSTQKYISSLIDLLWDTDSDVQKYVIGAIVKISNKLCKVAKDAQKATVTQQHRFMMQCIIDKIFSGSACIETEKYLDMVESHVGDNPYDDFYQYITSSTISRYVLDSTTLKIILRKIVEAYTIQNEIIDESKIDGLMSSLKIKNIDDVFGGDLPFSRSILVDKTDNVFDVLEPIAKVTVLGCTGTMCALLDTEKRSNIHLLNNLISVAKRYNNNETYDFLQTLLKRSKAPENSNHIVSPPPGVQVMGNPSATHDPITNHSIRDEFDIFQERGYENEQEQVQDEEEHRYDYFDLFLLCVTIRIHCIESESFPSLCTVM